MQKRRRRLPLVPGLPVRRIFSLVRRGDSLLMVLTLVLVCLLLGRYSPEAGAMEELGSFPVEDPTIQREELCELAGNEAIPEAGEPVRFLMHNVANYFVPGERARSRYPLYNKSEEKREAVADIIASSKPEVVGLIEMGGPLALRDLRERLHRRGLEYPYYRVLVREGEPRALAILSRYPIVQDHSKPNYGLYGQNKRQMLRGILDVTIRLQDGRMFRVLGAHLKSHVADDAAAADSLRQREAYTLARYIQQVMRKSPRMPLAVFGDWNDGPETPALQVIEKGVSKDSGLTRLTPVDSRGDEWTLYYRAGREYLVYDQIYVNGVLKKRMGKQYASGVVDIPGAAKASDHRAVWCEWR